MCIRDRTRTDSRTNYGQQIDNLIRGAYGSKIKVFDQTIPLSLIHISPVGLSSRRAVCVSRWKGFALTSVRAATNAKNKKNNGKIFTRRLREEQGWLEEEIRLE